MVTFSGGAPTVAIAAAATRCVDWESEGRVCVIFVYNAKPKAVTTQYMLLFSHRTV